VLLLLTMTAPIAWSLLCQNSNRLAATDPVFVPTVMKPLTEKVNSVDQKPVVEEKVFLTQVADAEFFGELVPPLKSALPQNHTFALVRGRVELTFAKGATTLLKAPALFSVEGPERLNLQVGSCSVYAPEGAEGFQVITPKSEVIDLGTRFFVHVAESGKSEVQVVEGAAVVRTASGQDVQVQTLTEGQAVQTGEMSLHSEQIPYNPKGYQSRLPDRIISYEAEPVPGTQVVRDLKSVTVQRGGQPYTYSVQDLIGIDVIHFRADDNATVIAWDEEYPSRPESVLDRDTALNTGLTNPGGRSSQQYATRSLYENYLERPGFAINFHEPIVNGPGPDIVFFEIQSPIYPPEGDAFRVGPLCSASGLRDHLISRYDITLSSRNALMVAPFAQSKFERPPRNLEEMQTLQAHQSVKAQTSFRALAVGIDLSDLGYAPNETAESLFFEDAGNDKHQMDPVFIGGFPSVSIKSKTGEPVAGTQQ